VNKRKKNNVPKTAVYIPIGFKCSRCGTQKKISVLEAYLDADAITEYVVCPCPDCGEETRITNASKAVKEYLLGKI
jgi:transcription elongation factor Elf1